MTKRKHEKKRDKAKNIERERGETTGRRRVMGEEGSGEMGREEGRIRGGMRGEREDRKETNNIERVWRE